MVATVIIKDPGVVPANGLPAPTPIRGTIPIIAIGALSNSNSESHLAARLADKTFSESSCPGSGVVTSHVPYTTSHEIPAPKTNIAPIIPILVPLAADTAMAAPNITT